MTQFYKNQHYLTTEQKAATAFLIYFAATLSKRYWLPGLNQSMFWLADVACFIGLPLVLFFAFQLPIRPRFNSALTATTSNDWSAVFFMAALCFLGIWGVGLMTDRMGWRVAQRHPDWLPMVINYRSHIPESGVMKSLVTVYFALTAAVVEEYIFRGLLGSILKSHVAFVSLSTLSFALIHWGGGFVNVFSAFFSGLILAIVYVRTKDLRVVMLAHGFYWLTFLF
jgi:membrane protease YdiL (CAAX protease family)